MKKIISIGSILLLSSLVIIGCGGGTTTSPDNGVIDNIDNNDSTTIPVSRSLSGVVRNYTSGVGLAGITLSIGSAQGVITGTDGTYTLPLATASSGNVVVKASGIGYAETTKVTDATSSLDIYMLPVAFTGTFDANQNYTAQVVDSVASVAIEGDSLVDSNGNMPSGVVSANLTPINPALDINLMPGLMVSSTGDSIESYGAIIINFTDASGNELNLASGKTSTIRIPVVNKSNDAPPASIPLYYFDKINGNWIEEGSATLSADGTYYEGSVTHFSTWNADYKYDTISVNGCIQDENGTKISNASIKLEGVDYIGKATTLSNSNGDFTISAKRNNISILSGVYLDKESNTEKIGDNESTDTDFTLNDCLVLGDSPLTARLTWGENPRDLDTHVMDGTDYHIWYSYLGSFATDNAKLDVDDITSYGPEIFTALRFPRAGTYHYSVYHFYGTSTISASPARVEVLLNGKTTLFTPPTGQGVSDTWWNVFDIIVDANNVMTIETVNTWTTTAPDGVSSYRVTKVNAK